MLHLGSWRQQQRHLVLAAAISPAETLQVVLPLLDKTEDPLEAQPSPIPAPVCYVDNSSLFKRQQSQFCPLAPLGWLLQCVARVPGGDPKSPSIAGAAAFTLQLPHQQSWRPLSHSAPPLSVFRGNDTLHLCLLSVGASEAEKGQVGRPLPWPDCAHDRDRETQSQRVSASSRW